MEHFYSTFEVAKMCHVSPASVTRWINDGVLKAGATVGGHKRVRAADIIELLNTLKMPVPEELKSQIASHNTPRILIVDDDEQVRTSLKHYFKKRFPSFDVEEAGEGFKAGWVAHGIHPDIILLDIMLPGFDGFSVCGFIRSFPELRHTKIIAITGYGAKHEQKIREMGADDFLSKPFEWDALTEKINKFLPAETNGESV